MTFKFIHDFDKISIIEGIYLKFFNYVLAISYCNLMCLTPLEKYEIMLLKYRYHNYILAPSSLFTTK